MTKRADLELDILTIRIPMRLQRRGGRKLIMTPEGVTAPARKPSRDETLVKALVRAHRWRRTNRERAGEVDHRPCGAGARHGRLRLSASPAHLPGAGYRRGDRRRAATEGAEARGDAGERAAGVGRAAPGFWLAPVSLIVAIRLPSPGRCANLGRSLLCVEDRFGHRGMAAGAGLGAL
jgi:hypothetical protein